MGFHRRPWCVCGGDADTRGRVSLREDKRTVGDAGPYKWTIPPSRLRRATSLYTREALAPQGGARREQAPALRLGRRILRRAALAQDDMRTRGRVGNGWKRLAKKSCILFRKSVLYYGYIRWVGVVPGRLKLHILQAFFPKKAIRGRIWDGRLLCFVAAFWALF